MNFEARRPVLSTYIIYCLPTTHVLSLVCPFVECVVKAPCVITVINSRVVRVICNITITGVPIQTTEYFDYFAVCNNS